MVVFLNMSAYLQFALQSSRIDIHKIKGSEVMLSTNKDFDMAIAYALDIEVFKDGSIIGSGQILSHSEFSVKLGSLRFIKDACEFRICSMVH